MAPSFRLQTVNCKGLEFQAVRPEMQKARSMASLVRAGSRNGEGASAVGGGK